MKYHFTLVLDCADGSGTATSSGTITVEAGATRDEVQRYVRTRMLAKHPEIPATSTVQSFDFWR